jgi:dTDP-4-dehydrorhamnose 3,5-epimerase-like enzyme
MLDKMNLTVIEGGSHEDERGIIRHVNDFDFCDIKRFYIIEQPKNFVRAWQGHKLETKYFYAVSGSFMVCGVKIDDWNNPSPDLSVNTFIISDDKSQILRIPGGYVNGFKSLEPHSKLLVFSNFNMTETKQDIYRFDKKLWHNWDND